jgi:hypothetical protein
MDTSNEDVSITMLVPVVAKEDFHLAVAAATIRDYFFQHHCTHLWEV